MLAAPPSPQPDQGVEEVSKSWQEPGWLGGSRMAGMGMPWGLGEVKVLFKTVTGG